MTRFTEKMLIQLKAQGKIRDFKMGPIKKKLPGIKPRHSSKAKDWISASLPQWARMNQVRLETEVQFHPQRKWRFDWALPDLKIAIEFEGGIYQANSGHKTAKHYSKDTLKYNRAQALGWKVLRFTALNYRTLFTELKACAGIL